MHVHRPAVDLGISDLYAARAAEKAAELKRAADVRRKLMKAAAGTSGIDEDSSEFGSLLVEGRSGEGSGGSGGSGEGGYGGQGQSEERSEAAVKAPPLSFWV
jgi:hypothetical protein